MSYRSDYFTIGATPCDEACAQVGDRDYSERARVEMRVFINLIKRVLGEPPAGARLHVKAFPHDFGTYHEVCCTYNTDDEAATLYAQRCEADAPATWDLTAVRQLITAGLPGFLDRLRDLQASS